ncbi:aminotransferase class V-fold PLP-dependent enzyme [Ponticoccus sp. SC2-23]|uniref:aminotransferase class V-fold PLP-dependent enzyme n=1 Tax=Alexandriicola marinus TaxID=2081710 RepID=UPI000FD84A5B|nr:aminotransferase class V-fold PLP-dependent enzyme [Alexandriicola marinus]MBM1222264.1 aminotransferase class V-fold PLP-dependent enzyme [Ponticoccus sp. SC6-9]MBM1224377.1 aminotransferase class V-fold PLP-dependent enzyme [Ponticoccus sp. SC6-15]MBM1229843.1 aminotransferase class V-fold PLP-dependent enzyme [Ponticoccus sp. SC6-38]MBM1233343.1 aminotransferase class V-fold PLP-dependent enzyme [Ponticoccus sp. SC6-45]MBM1236707.1 aminotransferase class V-fold PLP-dependent enzyme [Pont
MTLDLEWVRAQFPAFADPTLDGWSHFEAAGGSFACRQVIDRLTRFYTQRKVQPYAAYPASALGGMEMDEARLRLAAMLGVETHELSFGPSTTQNTYVLAQAARGWMKRGEAIIVTNQDHEANSGPWRRLEEDGIEIREWRIDPETGHLDPEGLVALLDANVRLVCFPHCSNVVGEINDVAAITRIAHDAGARVCVDGVSYAPHGFPDVGALGCDVYLFSAYKTYGPHQGIMVIREEFGFDLPNQGHHFNGDVLYKRFTPAGPDHAQVAASAGIADYMEALSAHHGGPTDAAGAARHAHSVMRDAEKARLQPLLDFVASKNSVRLIGPADADRRAPTVAMALEERGADVAQRLIPHRIMADGGDFYAQRPLAAMGVDLDRGVLRASFTHYTSAEDVDRLIDALDQAL